MNKQYERLQKCLSQVKEKVSFEPEVALVLGSGLGDYADTIKVEATLDYSEIDGFPVSTIIGHKGRFVFGYVGAVKVVIMQGRVHFYEGYPMEDVVLPIRLMKLMGAEKLFLTNAAGGVHFDFNAGDFMLISDQICMVRSPLIGANIDELGTRFPDMSNIYDRELREIVRNAAKKADIPLREGVYMQLTGPNFESPAEIRMARVLGADAVGMSTACEAIVANHAGMRVVGVSCISNLACGITDSPLTHDEVQETADKAAPRFKRLLTDSILGFGGN
ncbi:MAG: purine-nucleoside phosphorylase [Oscillospiraceae bacterium]|nr:purine-nucleoside phosphorylase [Oscillospiraceae bacterium]